MKYIGLLKDNMSPGGQLKRSRVLSTAFEKAKTRMPYLHSTSIAHGV